MGWSLVSALWSSWISHYLFILPLAPTLDTRWKNLSDGVHCPQFSPETTHAWLRTTSRHVSKWPWQKYWDDTLVYLMSLSVGLFSMMVSGAEALDHVKFSWFVLWSGRTLSLWLEDMPGTLSEGFSLFHLVPQSNLELWKSILGKLNSLPLTSTLL